MAWATGRHETEDLVARCGHVEARGRRAASPLRSTAESSLLPSRKSRWSRALLLLGHVQAFKGAREAGPSERQVLRSSERVLASFCKRSTRLNELPAKNRTRRWGFPPAEGKRAWRSPRRAERLGFAWCSMSGTIRLRKRLRHRLAQVPLAQLFRGRHDPGGSLG